ESRVSSESREARAEADAEARAEAREAATDQKIQAFYGVKQVGRSIVFATRMESAKQICLAGDFNGWSAQTHPMQPGKRKGEFGASVQVKPGRYRYRLVVDGNW